MKLECSVDVTDIDKEVSSSYDYEFDGTITREISEVPEITEDFSIGVIIGKSGSGKSTNLSLFGEQDIPTWNSNLSIASNFDSFEEAQNKLHGVGLSSIKAWRQSRHTLSTGEGYRADIAMMIKDGSVFDEFCSFLDEYTARTLSYSLGRYVRRMGLKRVVVATCREEIIEWLNPDWVFNCDTNEMSYDRRAQRRPSIDLEIHPCSVEVWRYFKDYHYLTGDINKGARCWVAFWGDKMVGFSSSIAMPSGSLKNAWRETRLVVLPEFQGVGIGNALSEYVARIHIDNGCRYFSKTASLMLGEHREKSKMWKSTSKNRMKRKDYIGSGDKKFSKELREKHAGRLTYSHEFIG